MFKRLINWFKTRFGGKPSDPPIRPNDAGGNGPPRPR
jgi:hypothetical protein